MSIKKKIIVALSALGLGAIIAKAATARRIVVLTNLPKNGNWPTRKASEITDITVHHTAGGVSETLRDIALWHINGKQWPGIAYHFVISKDGTIYQVNPVDAYTKHNGFNNRGAIGVCLQGNFEENYPSSAQIYSLYWIVRDLKNRYPNIRYLMGHKEYKGATLCPGKNLNIDLIRQGTGLDFNPKGMRVQPPYLPNQYVVDNESDN